MARRAVPNHRGYLLLRLVVFVQLAIALAHMAGMAGTPLAWMDLPALAVLTLVWLLPPWAGALGTVALALMVAGLSLDAPSMVLVTLGLTGVIGFRVGRWLDIEFIPVQVMAAAVVLPVCEVTMRVVSYLYFGKMAPVPWVGVLLGVAAAPAMVALGRAVLLTRGRWGNARG